MAIVPTDCRIELEGAIQRAIHSRNLAAIMQARIAQIDKHGHDPRADADRPTWHLPRKARDYLLAAVEHLERGGARDQEIAHRKLIAAGALCLAAADRLSFDRNSISIEGKKENDLFDEGEAA